MMDLWSGYFFVFFVRRLFAILFCWFVSKFRANRFKAATEKDVNTCRVSYQQLKYLYTYKDTARERENQ